MPPFPIPVAAPAADATAPDATADDATDHAADLQCGRCRQWFPRAADTGAVGDWWACPPCHDALFPNRANRSS